MTASGNILVFGKTGQLGQELAVFPCVETLDRQMADLTDPAACAGQVARTDCTAIIIAAAYTAVDRAEDEEALAHRINADAPGAIAKAAAARGLPVVYVSTDYVFDGSGDSPHRPDDKTAPLGAYGRSKRAGEEAVAAAGGACVILRTSWVFSGHGTNFLRTMLRLSESHETLSIVADQIGGPTPARALAEACLQIAAHLQQDPSARGIYHFSGAPETSWAGFARAIFRAAGREVTVREIPTADYPTPAARPLNSRLDCTSLKATFGIVRPDWRTATESIVRQLAEHT